MKEKLQNALKIVSGMNVAHALVLTLVGKAVIFDVSLSTVLLTVPVLGYEAYRLWLKSREPKPIQLNIEVQRELEQLKGKLAALTMDKNVKSPNARVW